MIEAAKEFQIVQQSLTGDRVVDEQTYSSLSVLKERLERLKAQDERFRDIGFSPDVQKFEEQNRAVVTG